MVFMIIVNVQIEGDSHVFQSFLSGATALIIIMHLHPETIREQYSSIIHIQIYTPTFLKK